MNKTTETRVDMLPDLNLNIGFGLFEKDQEKPRKRRRQFTNKEKELCWQKAPIMLGRHPDRWRLDAFGVPVCKVS